MNADEIKTMTDEQLKAITKDEFLALPAGDQRALLSEMDGRYRARVQSAVNDVFQHRELEAQLVPRLKFKPAATPPTPNRVEVSPPSGDPEQAARDFFRRFPETKSIRIGNTFYERG